MSLSLFFGMLPIVLMRGGIDNGYQLIFSKFVTELSVDSKQLLSPGLT